MLLGLYVYGTFAINAILIVLILKKRPSIMVKPSVWFAILYFFQIQTSATFLKSYIEGELNEPWIFFILTHFIPFVILIISFFTFPITTKKIWKKIKLLSVLNETLIYRKLLNISLAFVFLVLVFYLISVPFTSTGFYHAFIARSSPLTVAIARENSLKLLPSQALKYAFPFFQNILGIVSAICITLLGTIYLRNKNYKKIIPFVVLLMVLLVGVMLPGARIPGVYILFSIGGTMFFLRRGRVSLWKGTLGLLIVLLPAMLVEMAKFGLSIQDLGIVFNTIVVERVMSVPTEAGLTWVHFVENHGYWGVGGIPKIAALFGVKGLNVGNILMNKYISSGVILTGNLSVSYVFAYYSYFGYMSVPFLILGPILLDFYLYLYNSVNKFLLIPIIISLNMAAMNLAASEFFTIFLTYGFTTGAIFFLIIHFMLSPKEIKK